MTDPEVRDGFFLHEFEEDVEDGSMCVVCGIPDLVHDGAMKKRFGRVL